jgi:hypothetical protein
MPDQNKRNAENPAVGGPCVSDSQGLDLIPAAVIGECCLAPQTQFPLSRNHAVAAAPPPPSPLFPQTTNPTVVQPPPATCRAAIGYAWRTASLPTCSRRKVPDPPALHESAQGAMSPHKLAPQGSMTPHTLPVQGGTAQRNHGRRHTTALHSSPLCCANSGYVKRVGPAITMWERLTFTKPTCCLGVQVPVKALLPITHCLRARPKARHASHKISHPHTYCSQRPLHALRHVKQGKKQGETCRASNEAVDEHAVPHPTHFLGRKIIPVRVTKECNPPLVVLERQAERRSGSWVWDGHGPPARRGQTGPPPEQSVE